MRRIQITREQYNHALTAHIRSRMAGQNPGFSVSERFVSVHDKARASQVLGAARDAAKTGAEEAVIAAVQAGRAVPEDADRKWRALDSLITNAGLRFAIP